ncbi:MAG: response regulator [Candidatus Entotheonella factor]|uniref:Response regulator n=1 Tax=Entotheonella factor TaxID=1429438 RepID=W4LVT8_ENTF1|nr:MAG: response regulator [Candidatus Entotheonella factor]
MNETPTKILLVDDEIDVLRLLSIRLNASGYEVVTAESGEQALAQLSVSRPNLVITDLRMDGMDGMALFDAIQQSNTTLPVILLTAHGSIPDAIDATNRGVFSFLTKPWDSQTLLDHIQKALSLTGNGIPAPTEVGDEDWRQGIITRSSLMEDLLVQANMVAASETSVLIHGDSGTGKELLAQAIHRASPRRNQPFVPVNCGAIPETLLESELFGHAKGAFTGATRDYEGLFQAAHQGTLFLDEIGDMPLALQVKLLRVLQEKAIRPVGSTKTIPVDVRMISATHRDLEYELEQANFREDLYYRLNVVTLELPNLAARREDIPLLATHFLTRLSSDNSKQVTGFAPEAMEFLVRASWPGNVRQLLNVVEQTFALTTTPIISAMLVRKALREKPGELLTFADAKRRFEQEYLVQLLQITNGNVSRAARMAKRNRTEFYKLLHRHQIDPGLFKPSRVSDN